MSVARVVLGSALVATLGGCGWLGWFRKPTPAPTPVALAPTYPDAQTETAARAACSNYQAVVGQAGFPRDAIVRGLGSGQATVWFRVDGDRLTILSVASSDAAFGTAAADLIRQLKCTSAAPAIFRVPFAWRSTY